MSMLDTDFVDSFSADDVADPAPLNEEPRYVGQITRVNNEYAEPGKFRKFNKPLKDGRTEVPMITLSITAKADTQGNKLAGLNVQRNANIDFWVGGPDVIGRASLSKLVISLMDLKKEELIGQKMSDLAAKLVGGWVTFNAKSRTYTTPEGEERSVQSAVKVKPATVDEIGLVM